MAFKCKNASVVYFVGFPTVKLHITEKKPNSIIHSDVHSINIVSTYYVVKNTLK